MLVVSAQRNVQYLHVVAETPGHESKSEEHDRAQREMPQGERQVVRFLGEPLHSSMRLG